MVNITKEKDENECTYKPYMLITYAYYTYTFNVA